VCPGSSTGGMVGIEVPELALFFKLYVYIYIYRWMGRRVYIYIERERVYIEYRV